MAKAGLKLDTWAIISRAVEEGVSYGWRRAHKHTDTPTEDAVTAEIEQAVMSALSEVVKWD